MRASAGRYQLGPGVRARTESRKTQIPKVFCKKLKVFCTQSWQESVFKYLWEFLLKPYLSYSLCTVIWKVFKKLSNSFRLVISPIMPQSVIFEFTYHEQWEAVEFLEIRKIHRKTHVPEFFNKETWCRCFSVNFAKFLRTLFLTEYLG